MSIKKSPLTRSILQQDEEYQPLYQSSKKIQEIRKNLFDNEEET